MISRPTYFHYYYNVFKIKGIKGKFVVTSSLAALVALAAAVMSSRAASRRWQSSLNSVISFDFTASITCHKFHCVEFFCLLLPVFLFCVCCQGGCITPFFLLSMLKQKSKGMYVYTLQLRSRLLYSDSCVQSCLLRCRISMCAFV